MPALPLVLLLWTPPASSAAAPEAETLYEPGLPWEYPAPTLWFAELRAAEQSFSLVELRWLRARVLVQQGAVTAAELTRTRAAYEGVRANLIAQEGLLQIDIEELTRAIDDARGMLAIGSQDPTVVTEARQQLDQKVDEAAGRTEQAMRSALSHLLSQGSAALPAREALDRWWTVRGSIQWSKALDGGEDVRLARLDDARLAVEVAAAGLPQASKSLVEAVLRQGDEEEQLRRDLHAMWTRLEDPNDPFQQGALAEHIQQLAQARVNRQQRLQQVLDARDELERELDSLSSVPVDTTAETALDELHDKMVTLGATYDRLVLGMATLDARIDADTWCRVHVRSAQVRLMLGTPGADSLLRNAAAAYGGVCEVVVADSLQDPTFAATWAQNVLRLSREGSAHLLFDLGPGVWTLDGTPLAGAGAATYALSPGIHRIEYQEDGDVSHIDERIDPNERLCVSLSGDGGIGLDACPFGLASDTDGLPPTRTPYPGFQEDRAETTPHIPPGSFLSTSASWARLPVLGDTLDLLGASIAVGWRVGRSPFSPWHLSFTSSLYRSSTPLALTDTLITQTLPQERLALSWRAGRGRVQPVGELGVGALATFRVAHDLDDDGKLEDGERALWPPPTVDLGLGAQCHLSEQLGVVAALQLTQVFWAEPTLSPAPDLHIGLIRWY